MEMNKEEESDLTEHYDDDSSPSSKLLNIWFGKTQTKSIAIFHLHLQNMTVHFFSYCWNLCFT